MLIHELKIDNVTIPNNIFLAPMAGVTDIPYRKLCREAGAGMTYTEMVSSKAISYRSEKTASLYEILEDEHPIGVQLFGCDPKIMAKTAREISDFADIIDINMGCPANKIVKNNEGSSLMKNLPLAEKIIATVVDASKVPVTVKMRKGWDNNSINCIELAKIAESTGAKMVTIHGRTREEFYSGKADIDIIKQVKQAVNIPVIGNGDISSPEDAKQMFEYTGCDGIMIARASQGNPWIFTRIINYLNNNIILPEPSFTDRIDMALKHLELEITYKGEYVGIHEMRKNLSAYIKNFPNASQIRNEINKSDRYDSVLMLLNKVKEELA